MYEPSVGFMGAGFVGGSMIRAFSGYLRTFVYDKGKDIGDFELVIENSDVIFVSVPTPMRKSGACDTRIVEEVVMGIDQYLHKQRRGLREVIIRSTVPPLFLRELHGELTFVKLGFMPEFLTERTADLDFIMSPRFLLGSDAGRDTDLPHAHRAMQVRFPGTPIVDLSFEEASMIKYATNAFFTVKLSFFNELAQACDTLEQTYGYCDWETVRDELLQDGRIGRSHFQVPGHDGDYGWGGHCFPKDNRAFAYFLEDELEVDPKMTDAAWEKNNEVRTVRNWEKDKGRAVSDD